MSIKATNETNYEVLEECYKGWHGRENDYVTFIIYYLGIILKVHKEFTERVEHLNKKTTKAERMKKMFDYKLGKISKKNIVFCVPT